MFVRLALYDEVDTENFQPVAAWFAEHGPQLDERVPGCLGTMTLLDRGNARMSAVGVYATEADATAADAVMDQGPPPGMPPHLVEILERSTRAHRGVYEIIDGSGLLSVDAAAAH